MSGSQRDRLEQCREPAFRGPSSRFTAIEPILLCLPSQLPQSGFSARQLPPSLPLLRRPHSPPSVLARHRSLPLPLPLELLPPPELLCPPIFESHPLVAAGITALFRLTLHAGPCLSAARPLDPPSACSPRCRPGSDIDCRAIHSYTSPRHFTRLTCLPSSIAETVDARRGHRAVHNVGGVCAA
jgi:hypothetical protein